MMWPDFSRQESDSLVPVVFILQLWVSANCYAELLGSLSPDPTLQEQSRLCHLSGWFSSGSVDKHTTHWRDHDRQSRQHTASIA